MTADDVEVEREDDGRWIAEISDMPGILAYGETPEQAVANARLLAARVSAERSENHES
jgi:predicted RNase H-like HicB family nuclease